MTSFEEAILGAQGGPLKAHDIETLQVNVGYRCNQSCTHCHIGAHPGRHETMEKETMDRVLAVLEEHSISRLDITGGAPELNPHFRYLVRAARNIGTQVIVRTNLTVFSVPGLYDLPEFFRDSEVEVIASLPHFTSSGVNRMRGERTFEKSIESIKRLNIVGYGHGKDLPLDLVYNPPLTPFSGSTETLEETYRAELSARYNVVFNRLLVFANMPVGRFREFLSGTGGLKRYMEDARQAFNPATIDGLMCRSLLSVGWDGTLYDCDFNQALGLKVKQGNPGHVTGFDIHSLGSRPIMTGEHCFVCAAGRGSS